MILVRENWQEAGRRGLLLPQGERTTEARRGRKWEERPKRRAIISL